MSGIMFEKSLKFFFLTFLIFFNKDVWSENSIKFVSGIDDLPIFSKMINNYESLVIFDTNEGRFVKTEIYGEVKLKKLVKFYEKILPNLGWNKLEEMKFQRDDEVLILKYDKKDKIIFLTFNILPNKNF